MSFPYVITPDNISIVVKGENYIFSEEHVFFEEVRERLFRKEFEGLVDLYHQGKAIETWSQGHFRLLKGVLFYKERTLPGEFTRRILRGLKENFSISPYLKFWEKLEENPSNASVQQLFNFMVHSGIPITEDGDILAYKGVRPTLYDCYSNTNYHKRGAVFKLSRNQVEDNPNKACGSGLHVGSFQYAFGFGPKIVVCRVNPKNVVSVPKDCTHAKMRVSEYKVEGYFGSLLTSNLHKDTHPEVFFVNGDKPQSTWSACKIADYTRSVGVLGDSNFYKNPLEMLRAVSEFQSHF